MFFLMQCSNACKYCKSWRAHGADLTKVHYAMQYGTVHVLIIVSDPPVYLVSKSIDLPTPLCNVSACHHCTTPSGPTVMLYVQVLLISATIDCNSDS